MKAAASREAALVRTPTALAYWAAEHLPLDNANRQALLDAPSTVDRLKLLHKLAATVDGVHCRRRVPMRLAGASPCVFVMRRFF